MLKASPQAKAARRQSASSTGTSAATSSARLHTAWRRFALRRPTSSRRWHSTGFPRHLSASDSGVTGWTRSPATTSPNSCANSAPKASREWTISGVVKSCSQVDKFAAIRLAWNGVNPTTLLSTGERPKTGATTRRRIYKGDELTHTLQAAREPYKTLFALAAVTGARLSEVLGLVWADVDLDDLDAAVLSFEFQADRTGARVALKTEESRRAVEIPRQLAAMLVRHCVASPHTRPDSFVFAS